MLWLYQHTLAPGLLESTCARFSCWEQCSSLSALTVISTLLLRYLLVFYISLRITVIPISVIHNKPLLRPGWGETAGRVVQTWVPAAHLYIQLCHTAAATTQSVMEPAEYPQVHIRPPARVSHHCPGTEHQKEIKGIISARVPTCYCPFPLTSQVSATKSSAPLAGEYDQMLYDTMRWR